MDRRPGIGVIDHVILKVEKVKLRATSIFRKEAGLWKMVGHQTDKLPYLAK